MRITRWDGLISRSEAATMCGVQPVTVTNWIHRGYWSAEHGCRLTLPIAKHEGRRVFLDPREVAKAEHATAARARRVPAAGQPLSAR
jgi:uncharacterized protein YjcR